MINLQQQTTPLPNLINSGLQSINPTELTSIPLPKFIQKLSTQIHKLQLQHLLQKIQNIISIMQLIPKQINLKQHKQSYMKFLGIVTLIFSQFQTIFHQQNIKKIMRQLITILINKSTNTTLLLTSSDQDKLYQIKKWKLNYRQNQLIIPICSYIIQHTNQSYFQQIILLTYYVLQLRLKLSQKTIISFCQLLKKITKSKIKLSNLIENLLIMILNSMIKQIQINQIEMKLYANSLIFILQHCQTIQQINQLQIHIHPLSISSSLFQPNINDQNQNQNQIYKINLNQQKQTYFNTLCKLYIKTGIEQVIPSIKFLINTGTTTMMVLNVWNFFNLDNFHILQTTPHILRFQTILKHLQHHNKSTNFQCRVKKCASRISKTIHKKKPHLFILDIQMVNPHQLQIKKKTTLFKFRGQKGRITFFIKTSYGTISQKINKCYNNHGYQIWIKKQGYQQKSQPTFLTISNFASCTFYIQIKRDKKFIVYTNKLQKGLQVQHAIVGHLTNIFIGARQEKDQQCAIKIITQFYLFQQLTYNQFIKSKNQLLKNSANLKNHKKNIIKDALHDRKYQSLKKFNIFQFCQQNQNYQYLQQNQFIEFFSYKNIQLIKYRTYIEIINIFSGKNNLFSYILCSFQAIKDQNILIQYVKIIKQQYRNLQFTKQDYYQLFFTSAFCLQSYHYQKVSLLLCQLICSQDQNLQYILTNPQRKHQFTQKIQLKLQLVLDNLLRSGNINFKQKALFTLQQFLVVHSQKQSNAHIMIQLIKKLSFYLMNCINDWTITSPIPQKTSNSKSQKTYSSKPQKSNSKPPPNLQQILIKKQNFYLFTSTIKQIINKIIQFSQQSILVTQSIINLLRLFLIILVNATLSQNYYKKQYVFIIFQQIYQILEAISLILCLTQKIQNPQKICELLSEMYGVLPKMWKFCQKALFQNSNWRQQNYDRLLLNQYQSRNRNLELTTDQSYKLMQKYFRVCIQLGSFALKQKKLGYQTYIYQIYQSISNIKQSISYQNQISITQIIRSCWKYILNDPLKKPYKISLPNRIKLCQKYNELLFKYPIYYINNNDQQLFQLIFKFYISQAYQQNFAQNLLSKIYQNQLQEIIKKLSTWINQTPDLKYKYQTKLMTILNTYQKSLNYTLIKQPQPSQIPLLQWKQMYHWSQIFNQLKTIDQKIKSRRQQQLTNSSSNAKIYQQQYKQIQNKLNHYPQLQNQLKILNNLITKSQQQYSSYQQRLELLLNIFKQSNRQKYLDNKKLQSTTQLKKQNKKNIRKPTDKQNYHVVIVIHSQNKSILLLCSQYFLQMYFKLSKDKAMVLHAYYKIMDKLSLSERLFNDGVSNKYREFQYYRLDDYLNNQNVKIMLKRDYSSILNNLMIQGNIPRLRDQKQSNQYQTLAIKIIKNIQNFNKMYYIQQIVITNNQKYQHPIYKSLCVIKAYLVTKSKIYQGKIYITQKYINFIQNTDIDKNVYERLYATQAEKRTQSQIAIYKKVANIQIVDVQCTQNKRYLHKFQAIQIFSARLSYFFVFQSDQDRKLLLKHSQIVTLKPYQWQQLVLQLRMHWQNGWISNFNLLSTLNNISGRSFNDLSQYYIFPWIAINFKGHIDQQYLQNKSNYRDLSKSIGSINPQKIAIIINKYQLQNSSCFQGQLVPYMFGSFYSNPGVVSNYLLRVNPFTTHHYKLQGNQFDLYQRLFMKMDDQYISIYNVITDNRQLVPQFYSAPQFFRNRNQYNFSHQPKNTKINLEMKFPQWVITSSPQQFVFRMRMLLQSQVVSKQLGQWIDLIFGFKSIQSNAMKYNNLYMHQLYRQPPQKSKKPKVITQSNIFTTQQQVKAHMIKQFGQVPKTIFLRQTSLQLQKSISQTIINKTVKLITKIKQKQSNPLFIFDYCQCLLVISSNTTLSLINDVQNKIIKQKIYKQIQCISILTIKKTNYYLIFTINVFGQLGVYIVKTKRKQYKIIDEVSLFPSLKFKKVKTMGQFAIVVQNNSLLILKITQKQSKKTLFPIEKQQCEHYLSNQGYLFIHQCDITNLQTYQGLGIVVSIDQNGLVNIISVAPQLLVRATFKISYLKPKQHVNKVLIHSMGVMLLLTNYQQLLLYNIYGDIIMRVQLDFKGVTDIQFWDNKSSSEILLSTKFGILYKLQLFDMIKKQQDSLIGIKIPSSISQHLKINNKQNNKIVIHRFGLYWKIYIISSITQIYTIQCDNTFNQHYITKCVLKNCNQNSSYKNV